MPHKSSADTLKPFGGRFLKRISAPACSRLYSLEPIGIGTPMVESLTSYILRVALAHCIKLGPLVASEVAPILDKIYINDSRGGSISGLFLSRARAINGFGITATDWVDVMQKLTCKQDLHLMTMLPWKGLFAKRHLLRNMRAWCPYCYHDQRKTKSSVYNPLLWAIDVVSVCAIHKQFLQYTCFHCNRNIPALSNMPLLDVCPFCEKWLGCSPDIISHESKLPTDDDLRWQEYVIKNLGDIFAEAPKFPPQHDRRLVANFISAFVQRFSRGDLRAFVHRFNSFNHVSVDQWLKGASSPLLGNLMQLCYLAEVSVTDVFFERVDLSLFSRSVAPTRRVGSHFLTTADLEKIEEVLRLMLTEEPAPSVNEASCRLGCHCLTIKRYFPDLFHKIQERYKALLAERYDRNKVSMILSSARCENPPPSLAAIAKRLSCSKGFLRLNFREASRVIVNRHAGYRRVFPDPEETYSMLCSLQEEFPPLTIADCIGRLGCSRNVLLSHFPDKYRAIKAKRSAYLKKMRAQKIRHRRRAIIKVARALMAEGIKPNCYQVQKRLPILNNWDNREIKPILNSITY